jgi:hypothetical protein
VLFQVLLSSVVYRIDLIRVGSIPYQTCHTEILGRRCAYLENAKTNEAGRAVHEECYLAKQKRVEGRGVKINENGNRSADHAKLDACVAHGVFSAPFQRKTSLDNCG